MIGLGKALWRRMEDLMTVRHPPPLADVAAAVDEVITPKRPEPPPEPVTPVWHTCEPLTDSTGVSRARCPACRAWRELAGEDRSVPAPTPEGDTTHVP